FLQGGGYFRPDPVGAPIFFEDDRPVGLLDRLDNRFAVQGAKGAQIYHLAANPLFLFQLLGDQQRNRRHTRIADNGNVCAFLLDLGLANRQHVVATGGLEFRYFAFSIVKGQVFEEKNRVVVADRGPQQPFGVVGGGRRDYFQ